MLTEIVLALGYNSINKRLPANETCKGQRIIIIIFLTRVYTAIILII